MIFDTPSLLFEEISNQIAKNISQLPLSFPCEVTAIDSKNKGFVEIQTLLPQTQTDIKRVIPVLRSPYLSLPIKVGDIGIALNCSYLFEKALNDEKIEKSIVSSRMNGLFFVPLLPSSKVEDKDTECVIKSQNLKNKITLGEDNITASIQNKSVKFTDQEVDFGVKISQSQTPITIEGSGGSLYSAFNVMVQLMDLLSSGMNGSATNNSAYTSGKTQLIESLKQIVKE